jgi:hypothetical protein
VKAALKVGIVMYKKLALVYFALFIVSLPITWIWNHCWIPIFPIFHSVGVWTAFLILVMVRLIVSAVTKQIDMHGCCVDKK